MDTNWSFVIFCLGLPISCAIAYAIVARVFYWSHRQAAKLEAERTQRIIDGD
jgi:hypothetical protein